ncbi:MAG TPA: type II toxin-antitoxin system HicB family antitoxin [Ktedonobacterales bacterium]|nr:type II toxin-antitoxin system HicB family antitoxin [Ktedonobacterales bacterium]
MTTTFTAVFEQDDGWWIGYVEELPGANTQGATLDEARANLKEAVELVIEANRDLDVADPLASLVLSAAASVRARAEDAR